MTASRLPLLLLVTILPLATGAAPPPERPSLLVAARAVPGPPQLEALATTILGEVIAIDPSLAASAGLFDDAVRVPSFDPSEVVGRVARLEAALARLSAEPRVGWDVDARIDAAMLAASARTAVQQLRVERLHERRPAQWLEPVSGALLAFVTYAPERPELVDGVLARIPAMVAEMRRVCVRPTARDLTTAIGLARALEDQARGRDPAAAAALHDYVAHLEATTPADDFRVIGAEAYAWRLEHALLLPWSAEELLARAHAELATLDARLAELGPAPEPPAPTSAQRASAAGLDPAAFLALYDGVSVSLRKATVAGGWVTVPEDVPAVRARETPDALIPLTGDGGSMNPPPTWVDTTTGWWNVEHVRPDWTAERRLQSVLSAAGYQGNRLGPYAAHEGIPGHHLQLSVARKNPDPVRVLLADGPSVEGWALYAERMAFEHGALLDERAVLRSLRYRAARVVYDVNIETGAWTLQQGADFRAGGAPGEGEVDEDILRAVNWPTQLIGYYAGRTQLLELRRELEARQGAAFDERAFHDALLAEGTVPIALIRAAMLGEPIPGP